MFEALLNRMPIHLESNERLAGSLDSFFVTSYNLFKEGLESFDGYCGYEDLYEELTDENPDEVKNFWLADEFERRMATVFNSQEMAAMDEGVYFVEPVTGHSIFDAASVLKKGFEGLLAETRERSSNCRDAGKMTFYHAVTISLEAAISHACRFATMVGKMAATETDSTRKHELFRLKETLMKVPKHPATGFYEAVVSFWFTYVVMHAEQTPNPYAFSVGRIDQFLYPYYKSGIEKNELTNIDALELIEELLLKFNVGNKVWAVSQNAVVGGVDDKGIDATNELTYLFIEASEQLSVPLPTLTVKLHEGTPKKLMDRVATFAAKGLGNPTIINDDVVVKSKLATGVSVEDARDSVIAGCQELLVQGAENARTTACWFSLPKCLELSLNKGKSMLTGRQLGLDTSNPLEAKSFDEIKQLFWAQVDYFLEVATSNASACDQILSENRPVPFLSAITKDCIEKGIDFREGGARYNFAGFLCHGVANIADSFVAIRNLVFERQEVKFEDLINALKSNWEGFETIHQAVLNEPKYGNNEMEVDAIAVETAETISEKVSAYQTKSGATFRCGFSTPSTHVLYGRKCAATPDGRKHGESFAYGIGPMQGVNRKGPTAVIHSCTKFPHWKAHHGLALNFSLPPSAVDGEAGKDRLRSLISVYQQKGGRYLQFNIQDVEVLKKAQKHPHQYRDLIVRVHGMSAYFINLDPLIQQDIIDRISCGL